MKDIEQMSMIEVAEMLMRDKRSPQPIRKLLKEVAEMKQMDENDADFMAQLYIDITTSAKFVFCGEDLWDLKERNLDLWDKDGSYFNSPEDEEEDEDDLTVDDWNLEDEEDEDDDEENDDENDDDSDDDDTTTDTPVEEETEVVGGVKTDEETDEEEDDDSNDFLDEEEYNDMMDDYEELYDDK